MIQLFMKRSGSPVIVPLNLPASHDAMTEAASQLDEASRAGKTEIVEIKSVIANLPSYLGGFEPDSRTQLAQLNRLASIIAKMDSRERNIYAGALDGNSINDLNDMIRVAEQVSDYILIPNVNSDVTLGRYVAVAGQIQGDPRFPEAVWPYLDFSKIGAEYYAEHGGAYGYVVDTEHYRYCLRCTPSPGDYQGYLYCYDLRQQQMAQQAKPVGRVTFADGSRMDYTDAQEYLRCIQKELPQHSVTGFRYETLTDDLVVRKQVDDILFDLYGEENPQSLTDYENSSGQGMKMGGM